VVTLVNYTKLAIKIAIENTINPCKNNTINNQLAATITVY
jgi:hypothetical protein